MRVFTGWRTTISDTFLHSDMLDRLQNQSIIPLPSGQLPAMYAANHMSFFKNKAFKPIPKEENKITVESWSQNTIKNVYITNKNIIQRFMVKSLKEAELKMYKPYTEKEINKYLPKKINS